MTHPYEPAAQIAERAADRCLIGATAWNDFHKTAGEIRALPRPPERVLPVFTADWVLDIMLSANNPAFFPEAIASAINARIAASGFAQSDLASELVNGADRIDDKSWQYGYDRAIADTQARIDAAVLAERQACKDAAVVNPPPDTKGADDRVELLRQRVTVLEYALLDVAKQARPLREWGGNVGAVMIAARKNGWEGTGK